MRYEALFFDFDGTLVDSAKAKRQAFLDLFPDSNCYTDIVRRVLAADPDGSRHRVIPRMLAMMRESGVELPSATNAERLVGRYTEAVLKKVENAPELPGATELLDFLVSKDVPVYLCSNTPQQDLSYLVERRGWTHYFEEIAGHPRSKTEFVHEKLVGDGLSAGSAAFVGDGVTDKEAADRNSIRFFAITGAGDLQKVAMRLKEALDV